MGYRYISIFQIGLTAILIISLPLWKQFHKKEHIGQSASGSGNTLPVLTLKQIFQIPGAREILFAFFCYSAVEQTSSLWASSYLVLHLGYSSEKAAGFASLFFIGITVGRGISGFITFKLNDSQMIHLGEGIILLGVLAMLLPLGKTVALAIIGVQMAFAYIGTCLMPPLFGIIARSISITLFPAYLGLFLCIMFFMYETVIRKTHTV